MKRIPTIVAVVVLTVAGSGLLLAQGANDAFVGTWKLNLAKSKFTSMPAPKSETRTVEPQGNGLKISYDGVAADGSHIAYSFTTNLDYKPAPATGAGIPDGADMMAEKRINGHNLLETPSKAGNSLDNVDHAISTDGKVWTSTAHVSAASPLDSPAFVTVWDKQ